MASRITWQSGISLAVAAAFITACGSDSGNNGNGNNGGTNSCSMTLSGAQTGTIACTAGDPVLERSENNSEFQFTTTGTPTLAAFVKVPGATAAGTYQFSGVAFGTVTLTNGASQWYAANGSGGTMSLTITSVTTTSTTSTLIAYKAHGTLTATLAPVSSTAATGNVTVTLTF
jgi:hypothetical protein